MVSCYYFLALTGQNLDFELQRQLSPSTPPSSTSLFVDEVCVEAQTAYFRNCIRFKVQYLLKISRDGKKWDIYSNASRKTQAYRGLHGPKKVHIFLASWWRELSTVPMFHWPTCRYKNSFISYWVDLSAVWARTLRAKWQKMRRGVEATSREFRPGLARVSGSQSMSGVRLLSKRPLDFFERWKNVGKYLIFHIQIFNAIGPYEWKKMDSCNAVI